MIRIVAFVVFTLVAAPTWASQWTSDQADFARHGFRNGAWDCYGRCSGRHYRHTYRRIYNR